MSWGVVAVGTISLQNCLNTVMVLTNFCCGSNSVYTGRDTTKDITNALEPIINFVNYIFQCNLKIMHVIALHFVNDLVYLGGNMWVNKWHFQLFLEILIINKSKRSYQLLKTLLPWIGLLILFWVYLVELSRLWMHHGSRVLEHLHVQSLPAKQTDKTITLSSKISTTDSILLMFTLGFYDVNLFKWLFSTYNHSSKSTT